MLQGWARLYVKRLRIVAHTKHAVPRPCMWCAQCAQHAQYALQADTGLAPGELAACSQTILGPL